MYLFGLQDKYSSVKLRYTVLHSAIHTPKDLIVFKTNAYLGRASILV